MFCGKCGNQIPDGVAFCPFCGEKLVQAVAQAAAPVAEAAQNAAAPVVEEVQNAAAPVVEAAAPVVEAAAPVVEAAPVPEAPVQQPVYQQAPVEQPVYQQPVYQQPVYQQPAPQVQQPVYQQPMYQQPVYQQPLYQQYPDVPKKKSKAPLIIIIVLLVLLLAGGGLIVYETFFADEEDRPEILAMLDFKKEGDKLPLSEKEQKTFTKIVKNMDQAIIDTDGDAYAECIPSYARSFVWGVYGETSADAFVKYLYGDKDNGISKLGDDIKVTEEIVSAKKISKLEDLSEAFEKEFKKSLDFDVAYLVTNNSCFKGDEDSQKYVDYYLFFREEDEEDWNVILIGEENLEKFGLK